MREIIDRLRQLGMRVARDGYLHRVSIPGTQKTLDMMFKEVLPQQKKFKCKNEHINVDGSLGIEFTNTETAYLKNLKEELEALIDNDRIERNYVIRRPINFPIIIVNNENEGTYCCMKKSELRAHIYHPKRLKHIRNHIEITLGSFICKFGDLDRVIKKIGCCLDDPKL